MTNRKRSILIGGLHISTQILCKVMMTDLPSIKDLIRMIKKLCGQSTHKNKDCSLRLTMFIYHFNRAWYSLFLLVAKMLWSPQVINLLCTKVARRPLGAKQVETAMNTCTHIIAKIYDIFLKPYDAVYSKQKKNCKLTQANVFYIWFP